MEEIASNFNNLNLNLFSYFKSNSTVKSESVTPSLHLSIEIQTSSKKPVLLDKIRPQQLPTNRFEFRQRLNGTQRIKSHRLPTSQLPAYFYLSSSAPQLKANSNNNFNRQSHHQYYSSIHDQQPPLAPIATGYKSGNNELYSIFISMFTAAVFLIFIMWRWIRLKSDLRQALREQNEIEREMRLNGSSGSSPPNSLTCTGVNSPRFDINAFRCSYNRVNNPNLEMRRQRLEALINQLSSSPNRDSYHNRQILATAKYCLHQLRMQAQRERTAAERDYLSGYFSYGQRYDRSLFDSGHGGGGSSSTSPTTTPSSITPLNRAPYSASSFGINATTSSSSTPQQQLHYHLHHSSGVNESPPSYESLMTKSSSLPSYCHLSNVNDISSHGSKDDSIDRSK